jgi:hypothetical protein
MALPTIYVDTGGAATNSGSSDGNSPTHSSTINSVTASVTGSTVTFSGAIDISAVANDGSATIYINDATNTNQKVFKITAVDDGANTVTVDVAPTGTIATSTWAIGGRFLVSAGSYDSVMSAAVTAGWTVQFNNSPASHSGSDFITLRNAGTDAAGPVMFVGASGALRALTVSDTNQVITGNIGVVTFENLEIVQSGASGSATDSSAAQYWKGCKFSDAGGVAVSNTNGPLFMSACEITASGSHGIGTGANLLVLMGNYIHDLASIGIAVSSNANGTLMFNIIDTCVGQAYLSSDTSTTQTSGLVWINNTIYGCGSSGLETTDTAAQYLYMIMNNIFSQNGDGAGEYNIEWDGYTLAGIQGYNILYHSGGGGGDNLLTYVANSTELTSDPVFTDAANGDFSLQSSSPGKAAGFPGQFLGGSLGYLDIGAVQREEPASSPGGTSIGGTSFGFA